MEKTKNEKTINVRQNEEMDLRKIVPWICFISLYSDGAETSSKNKFQQLI